MRIQGVNYDLRTMVRDRGIKWFAANIVGTLMESRENNAPPILTPWDFSIKELHEAVDTRDFPVIVGELISRTMIDSYNAAAKIGDMLVSKMPSTRKQERMVGFDRTNKMQEVEEGMPYPHVGRIDEKYATIEAQKQGQILDVTEEAVMFDQTNQILSEAAAIGEDAALDREYEIIMTVTDQTGYKAWYPSGTQVDLYGTTTTAPHSYSNQITNVLTDHTDIDAAVQLFAGMKNKNGRPIVVNPNTLLVPSAKLMTAKQLIASGVDITKYNAVPNPVQNDYTIASSPMLDAISTTQWYLGNFKKQFVWQEIIPFQVLTRKRQGDDNWNRDVVASYKARWFGKCGAKDYIYVVKSLGTV